MGNGAVSDISIKERSRTGSHDRRINSSAKHKRGGYVGIRAKDESRLGFSKNNGKRGSCNGDRAVAQDERAPKDESRLGFSSAKARSVGDSLAFTLRIDVPG